MIEPLLSDDALLADIERAAADADALHLWWLGQSGFFVRHGRSFALLDPYLSDSLTRKYAGSDKPHVRMSRRVIAPERLAFASVVSSSHNHTDHLDPNTLKPLLAANPDLELVIPEANRAFVAERLNIDTFRPIGLDGGTTVTVNRYEFTGIPAAHETVDRDEAGHCKYLGYVIRVGPWTIYHSGDTVLFDGLLDRLRQFRIDVALLPINGRAPERRVAGNMTGIEAAQLAHAAGARLVIPCHYDMFEFNTASPDAFVAESRKLNQPHRVLAAGERCSLRRVE